MNTNRREIHVIGAGKEVALETVKHKVAVVIDVFRATSVILTALEHGARSVVPVETIEEALVMEKSMEKVVLGGERKAMKIEGFHLSNSPLDYTKEKVMEKNVVLTTTNGTLAIQRASGAKELYIGAMRNAKAVAKKLLSLGEDVVLINAGTGGQFSMDDFITSGAIIHELMKEGDFLLTDFAKTAWMAYEGHQDLYSYVKEARHYEILMDLGLEKDIAYCLEKDASELVPRFLHGIIVIEEEKQKP